MEVKDFPRAKSCRWEGARHFSAAAVGHSPPLDSSLSRSTKRRVFARQAIALRANKAISALNSLYFECSTVGGVQTVQDLESLPLCQADCLRNLLSMVKQLGPRLKVHVVKEPYRRSGQPGARTKNLIPVWVTLWLWIWDACPFPQGRLLGYQCIANLQVMLRTLCVILRKPCYRTQVCGQICRPMQPSSRRMMTHR